jgi:AAA+ ATPase superfamily predicted ATPase
MTTGIRNPFRPGAGHMPPYLAGREAEALEFSKILSQERILQNLILTGLRGVGKTVLLDSFKPLAIAEGWIWVGADFSESSSVSERTLAMRLLTDLAIVTSGIVISSPVTTAGFVQSKEEEHRLDFEALMKKWNEAPGLPSDKLKSVLEYVWAHVVPFKKKGVIFAYDEAQNLTDHPKEQEYPLSLLLDVFQSIQRKGIPFLLVLTGLPTLFPKLVEARTYAERMFHVVSLDKLSKEASSEAIVKPTQKGSVKFSANSVNSIYEMTQGHPYFIQYVCREVFDIWVSNIAREEELAKIPVNEILQKLDADFFSGRWSRATDRQRDLLAIIAQLKNSNSEFTVQEIVEFSMQQPHPFSNSHVNQMLSSLCSVALVHKNRWGKYILAVPLLDEFIRRQLAQR